MTAQQQVRIAGWLMLGLTCALGITLVHVTIHAHAAGVSQPSSAPAAAAWWTTLWAWAITHKLVILGALLAVLPTVITSITKYVPKATGFVTFLQIVLDVLSFWGPKNSPTNLNLPWRRSLPPRRAEVDRCSSTA